MQRSTGPYSYNISTKKGNFFIEQVEHPAWNHFELCSSSANLLFASKIETNESWIMCKYAHLSQNLSFFAVFLRIFFVIPVANYPGKYAPLLHVLTIKCKSATLPPPLRFFPWTFTSVYAAKDCALWKLRPTSPSSVIFKTYLLVNNVNLPWKPASVNKKISAGRQRSWFALNGT